MKSMEISKELLSEVLGYTDNSGQYRTFTAETEVEAIIKACEWVLNEKYLQH